MEYESRYQQQIPTSKYECLLFDVDDTLYALSSGLSTERTKNIREETKVPEMCATLYWNYRTTMVLVFRLLANYPESVKQKIPDVYFEGRSLKKLGQKAGFIEKMENGVGNSSLLFSIRREKKVVVGKVFDQKVGFGCHLC